MCAHVTLVTEHVTILHWIYWRGYFTLYFTLLYIYLHCRSFHIYILRSWIQVCPKALAKFSRLTGRRKLIFRLAPGKLRCTAFQRCVSWGGTPCRKRHNKCARWAHFFTHFWSNYPPFQTSEIPKKNRQPLISTRGLAFNGLLRSSEKWKLTQFESQQYVWQSFGILKDTNRTLMGSQKAILCKIVQEWLFLQQRR